MLPSSFKGDERRRIIDCIHDVKRRRAFGLMVNIEPWQLDEFEKYPPSTTVTKIVQEWFIKEPMRITERLKETYNVLVILHEQKLANRLQQFARQHFDLDLAIYEKSHAYSSNACSLEYIGN